MVIDFIIEKMTHIRLKDKEAFELELRPERKGTYIDGVLALHVLPQLWDRLSVGDKFPLEIRANDS